MFLTYPRISFHLNAAHNQCYIHTWSFLECSHIYDDIHGPQIHIHRFLKEKIIFWKINDNLKKKIEAFYVTNNNSLLSLFWLYFM